MRMSLFHFKTANGISVQQLKVICPACEGGSPFQPKVTSFSGDKRKSFKES